jgi:hypothetical protein
MLRRGEDIDAAIAPSFSNHAAQRTLWGMPVAGANRDGAVACLVIGDQTFWGRNAHGRPKPVGFVANAISRAHAEGDVMIQAYIYHKKNNDAFTGLTGTLVVDRAFCAACGIRGGVRGMAKCIELAHLNIYTTRNSDTNFSF